MVEVLKQGRNQPIDVEKQVCILYAVINNYLMDVPVERVSLYEQGCMRALTRSMRIFWRRFARPESLKRKPKRSSALL